MNAFERRHARGAATPVIIAVIAILLLLGVAAWFLIFKPNQQAAAPAIQQSTQASKVSAAEAPPPANVESMSTSQLLAAARSSMNDQRLLAPAGNNAFEFYLKVLERQPDNQVAQDALRETFPFGANAAEQAINQRDYAEAQREIDLLTKADPDNYTLTILRSKLDAQRKTQDREQQQAEQQELAQKKAADEEARKQQAAAALAQQQEAARKAAARNESTQQAATKKPATTPTAPAPVKEAPQQVRIQDAVLVRQVKPRYPSSAQRARQEGWVDVEFTVGTGGDVGSVKVVDAKPHHVFDRAATDAVERWQFQPALRNGNPMAVTMRRRLVFSQGR